MIKKVIKFEDFDGNEREVTAYFHFTKSEITSMNVSVQGGLLGLMQHIIDTLDGKELVKAFETIILGSYGIKSPDGMKFEKSEEISKEFKSTLAYDKLFMELGTDAKAFAEFINGILPSDMKASDSDMKEVVEQAQAAMNKSK